MGDVIDLNKFKLDSDLTDLKAKFKEKYGKMDKLSLLESMVTFQEARSRIGIITPKMMVEGQELFGMLEMLAETPELRQLASSYRRHCAAELKDFLDRKKKQ